MKLMRLLSVAVLSLLAARAGAEDAWPPLLPGSENGTVTLTDARFLEVPPAVVEGRANEGAAPFVVAEAPPTVDFAYHRQLDEAMNNTGWSSWGDIGVANSGKVYVAIGDHGDAPGGTAKAYLYEWNPETKTLQRVLDINTIVPREHGEPTWSKVHARIDEGADGKIYFSGTLNSGNRANQPNYHWSEAIPGGQLYSYDPATGEAAVAANLPAQRATATSLLDRARNIWWCNLESGPVPNALYGIDIGTGKVVYRAADGSTGFNRNFALARDGRVYVNGPDKAIWRCDPEAGTLTRTASSFDPQVGMRASTRQASDGYIYGVTHRPGTLFRYHPERDELKLLGPDFLSGDYTTVCVLSPDEKFLYYLPGAHGGARKIGTPVVQYRISTGERKVIAFLRGVIEARFDYVAGGTYGVKISADGSTLYANLNGHAGDSFRPEHRRPNGFGLTSFVAVHIPQSER